MGKLSRQNPTYTSWRKMKERCSNPREVGYPNYGGRGIKVCARWENSFANFLEDMGERPDGCSLDRIDNNGDYGPGNCRWATKTDQCRNTRRNHYINIAGERRCLAEWIETLGLNEDTVYARLRRGVDPVAALSGKRVQTRKSHGRAKINEEVASQIRSLLKGGTTQQQLAKRFGLNQSTISDIKRGVTWG